ncbi:MAG: hypothetical protein Q9M76_02185, partial [Candidatus Dojkabacteria bacterium]|nr:hypothetical protein [Candidatus Dojkabacteria bacterium]
NLNDLLAENISLENRIHIVNQLSEMVQFASDQRIIINDITPWNFYVDEDLNVYFGDLGGAIVRDNAMVEIVEMEAYQNLAPELKYKKFLTYSDAGLFSHPHLSGIGKNQLGNQNNWLRTRRMKNSSLFREVRLPKVLKSGNISVVNLYGDLDSITHYQQYSFILLAYSVMYNGAIPNFSDNNPRLQDVEYFEKDRNAYLGINKIKQQDIVDFINHTRKRDARFVFDLSITNVSKLILSEFYTFEP